MTIENPPFTPTKLEGDRKGDFLTIRLNSEERDMLERVKRILRQPKDSTALKQMFVYGMAKILHDPSNSYLLGLQFRNLANSQESGNYAEDAKKGDL